MASSSYEISGKIKTILDVQTFASGFCKREFVLTTEEDYPQQVKLQFVKDRCSLLDKLAVGDRVKVTFSIRGSEFKERFYVDLQAFRIEKLESDGSTTEAVDDDFAAPVDDVFGGSDPESMPF